MKIAILGATNIKHMSLLSHYLDNINLSKNTIDIIYTDKYGIDEKIEGINEYYKYRVNIHSDWSFIKKAKKYYGFKPYASKLLKNNNYDFVIVWGSYTAHLFKNILKKNYPNKYILNVRDYFYENNKLIKHRMKKIVEKSLITTLSSEGFMKFLPHSNKYQVIYSYNSKIIDKAQETVDYKKTYPLNLGFIGNVRFNEINKKLMSELANDERFVLQYFGTGVKDLIKYADDNDIKNVSFKDGFAVANTYKFLDKIDILNNLFGNNEIALDTALSIRMYYSLFLNKPILTTKDTFTAEETNKFGLGFATDPNNIANLGDKLFYWFENLNKDEVNSERAKYMKKVINNNSKFYNKLESIFNE